MQRMAHDSGECATAAAAAKTGTLMTLSSWSTTALEQVAEAGGPGGARWFQLYVYKVGGWGFPPTFGGFFVIGVCGFVGLWVGGKKGSIQTW